MKPLKDIVVASARSANRSISSRPVARRRSAGLRGFEVLESRQLFAAFLATDIPTTTVNVGTATTDISLSDKVASATVFGTVVQLQTTLGNVDIELFERRTANRSATPITAANFLTYTNANRYDNTVFHRSVSGFVVQGGGFGIQTNEAGAVTGLPAITTNPTIQNEFNADRSNLRGTIAMAKLGGDPNSATSQFFFNLGNNASNLDNQNGGFTVFARVLDDAAVTTDGLAVVDALAAVPVFNADNGGTFAELPLRNFSTSAANILPENLLTISDVVVQPSKFTVTSSNSNLVTPTIVTDSSGNATLRLTYGNNASGTATITFTGVTDTGEVATSSFTVNVTGSNIRPTAISLPAVVRGGQQQTVNVTIANAGTTNSLATDLVLRLTGTSKGQPIDLSLGTISVPSITGGASTTLPVTFTLPNDLSATNYTFSASLDPNATSGDTVVSDNVLTNSTRVAPTGKAVQVDVSGTEILNNGTALDFNRALQGEASNRISVRVTNVGTEPVTLTSVTLSAPFSIFDTSSFIRSTAANVRPVVLNLPQTLTVAPDTGSPGSTNSARVTIDADSSIVGRTLGTLVINTDATNEPTFTVNLRQTIAQAVVLGDDGNSATAAAGSFSFTDADGSLVTVTYKGTRQAVLGILGDNVSLSGTTRLTATGSNIELVLAEVGTADTVSNAPSDARGTLSITAKGGNGFATIEQIDIAHAFRSITGRGIVVTDAIRTAARIDTINVTSLDSATVALEASSDAAARVALTFANVTDSAISSNLPVKSLTVGSYSDTGERQTIAAVAIDSIKINGGTGFGSNLNITSVPVKSASFKLPITGGTWTLSRAVGTLSTGAVSDGTSFTFSEGVRTFNVAGDFAGDIDGTTISSLNVRGAVNSADVDLTGDLTKFAATGAVTSSRFEAGARINNFTASALNGSNIYVGVTNPPTSGVPTTLAFGTTSEIGTVSLRSRTNSYVNSSISARNIKSLSLNSVQIDNSNTSFGIGADTLSSVRFTPGSQRPVSLRNITTQTQVTTFFSTQQITTDDLLFSIA